MLQEQVWIFQQLAGEADIDLTIGQRSLAICSLEQDDGVTLGTCAGDCMIFWYSCQGQDIRACAIIEWMIWRVQ